MARGRTTGAIELIRRRYGTPDYAGIATQIFRLRKALGLSQNKLAELMGTTQSTISRLEDPNYGGYSLSTLCRVAEALNHRVVVTFKLLGKR